jgi:DNA-binding HxlR family transcriptional regulator
VQRTSTPRATRDLLEGDDRDLPKPPLVRGEVPALFVVDPGRNQAKAFSTYEELAVQFAITLLEGKWRVPILRELQSGPIHFGELKRRLSPVSKKVLNQHLRQMATDRLIIRTDYTGKVPRVEYSLANPLGYAVLDLLQAVAEWGDRHCRQIKGREIKADEMSLASRD